MMRDRRQHKPVEVIFQNKTFDRHNILEFPAWDMKCDIEIPTLKISGS